MQRRLVGASPLCRVAIIAIATESLLDAFIVIFSRDLHKMGGEGEAEQLHVGDP